MSYRKSRAIKGFQAELLGLFRAVRDFDKGSISSDARRMALGGMILLCSARIEDYLEDLVEDWGKALGGGVQCAKLPPVIRAFLLNGHLEEAYRKLVANRDEAAFLTAVAGSLVAGHLEYANASAVLSRLDVRAVYERVKYPSPKNIRRLFFRLRIDRVFHKLNASARRDVELDLTSFNDLRTELAHTGNSVNLTAKDVRRHLVSMAGFVAHVDRVFHAYVLQVTGSTTWTT